MRLDPYRRVLRLPGVRPLILLSLLMRLPVTAAGITLTLHVVLGLDRGYGAAGLVGGLFTVGAAIGATLWGRFVDRRGLRPMLVATVTGVAVFWTVAPLLPYPVLLGAALLGGLSAIPIFSIIRQSLAALVPEDERKPAYSIDSMSVEVSFMVGPALAVLAVTQISTTVTAWLVGAAIAGAGVGLWLLNPPVRGEGEAPVSAEAAVPRRTWLRPRLVAVLAASMTATLILAGTDVGVVALLRGSGDLEFAGLVIALWSAYSLVGGFVYGTMRHAPHPLVLALALGLTTIPIGLATGWVTMCLILIPAGVLCAPLLASTADAVSRMVPAAARGEAMGMHASALTVGMATGAPFAGAVADWAGPGWAFVAVGAVGAVLAAVGLVMSRRGTSVPDRVGAPLEAATS